MNSTFPHNVVNSTGGRLGDSGESLFLARLFAALQSVMGGEFDEFTFVVHHRQHGELPGRQINLMPGGPKSVLILLSDECEVFPLENFPDYRAVFRSYGFSRNHPRIHDFPVGYLNAAGQAVAIPFEQRKHPVFFCGCLNGSRIDFYKQFEPIRWLPQQNIPTRQLREIARRLIVKSRKRREFDNFCPDSLIRFTDGFGRGFVPDEYARILADTKIALCPPGFVSSETIRHWEAMRLGCIVISGPLPPNRFYRGSPIIQLRTWSDLRPVIDNLLENPREMIAIHQATTAWWRDVCSGSAVASYMADRLKTTL